MPHFTLQVGPNGPILNALIGVSQARATALKAADQPIPQLVPITALVDTGASCTCLDPSVVQALSLTPTGSVLINTPTTGSTPHTADQFDVGLFVPAPNGPPLFFRTMPVVSAELLGAQGFHALLGRDILKQCFFAYNGDVGLFTLAF